MRVLFRFHPRHFIEIDAKQIFYSLDEPEITELDVYNTLMASAGMLTYRSVSGSLRLINLSLVRDIEIRP